MKKVRKYGSLLIIIGVLAGCNASKKAANDTGEKPVNPPLRGVYWRLTNLLGQPLNESPAMPKEAFIKFNIDGKRVGGNGGCNTFGGNYNVSDDSHISFGPMMSTKMSCDDAKFENVFLNLISRADSYLISGDTLFLRNAGMDSTAKFVADYLKK